MSNSNLTHWGPNGTWHGNLTLLLDHSLCTLETCDLTLSSFLYLPSLPANTIYAAIFGIYLITQLFLGIKHKTWGYMCAMVLGLALEVVGYVGRILLYYSPFDYNNFLIYLVTLTIAPALLSASVSIELSCSRAVLIFSPPRSTYASPASLLSTAKTFLVSGLASTRSSSVPATSSVSSYKL